MARKRDPELEKQRRAQIMRTVFGLLVEGSHRALTLDAVAREAGISKGVVTYWFKSKDALIVSTIRHFIDVQMALLEAVMRSPRDARERLRLMVEAAFPSREEVERQLRFQVEVWSFAKGRPEALDAVRESYRAQRAALLELLQAGTTEGYVTNPDVDDLQLLIQALTDGMSLQIALDPELDIDAIKGRLLDLIDRALTTP